VNPALLIALIEQIAVPELKAWLAARAAAGQPVTDADVIAKLASDTNLGEQIGKAWLDSHPV
jgi:predicted transcriptional regulator